MRTKAAVKHQELARRDVDMRIEVASDLLASRRQDRTGAEIIKLVHA